MAYQETLSTGSGTWGGWPVVLGAVMMGTEFFWERGCRRNGADGEWEFRSGRWISKARQRTAGLSRPHAEGRRPRELWGLLHGTGEHHVGGE